VLDVRSAKVETLLGPLQDRHHHEHTEAIKREFR
jgi:hypothetical protein